MNIPEHLNIQRMHEKLSCALRIKQLHRYSVDDTKRFRNNRLTALMLIALCNLLTGIGYVQSDSPYSTFEVEYSVGNNYVTAGNANLSLKKEGAVWIYRLTTLPTGIFKLAGKGKIEEISVLLMDDDNLKPQRYSYRQDAETSRNVDAWFDWEEKQLKYTSRGTDGVEDLTSPILDRLSVTLAVREQLRLGFDQLAMAVFDTGRIKSMVFNNEGAETLSTKLGETETIRIKSLHEGGSKRRATTTWFAPDLDYIPVKIEQHKDGTLVARLTITRLVN